MVLFRDQGRAEGLMGIVLPDQNSRLADIEKEAPIYFSNVSNCHFKEGWSDRDRPIHPSFGMTMTKVQRKVLAWQGSLKS